MCGLVGLIGRGGDLEDQVSRMAACLQHRGPDGSGVWCDQQTGLGLGHRRLAILDLSVAGHQPMFSESGRWVLVLNGEIYNHSDLRKRLEPRAWRGHSDTEVLVEALDRWGLVETLAQAQGMFALAAFDREERALYLARDRLGEKPLYYGWTSQGFVFASELSALAGQHCARPSVSREALALLLRHAYIPAPYSIFQDVYKLEPGCFMRLNLNSASGTRVAPQHPLRAPSQHFDISVDRYWSLGAVVQAASARTGTQAELQGVLSQAIGRQLVADVPVGAFLSGGIDSSLVVALAQKQLTTPIKTFTIGFQEKAFDESSYARAVAHHLGTDHHELIVTPDDAREVIPRLPEIYSEPFGDVSQIPTYLVCLLARRQVTVALSGDGGDELFGGYTHFTRGAWLWRNWRRLPAMSRRLIKRTYGWLDSFLGGLPGSLASTLRRRLWNSLSLLYEPQTFCDFHERLVSRISDPIRLLKHAGPGVPLLSGELPPCLGHQAESGLMYLDSLSYLPDDILCKVDRAAMAVGLETRVPMLDPKVVEAAWSLPLDEKFEGGQGKQALRRILDQFLPRSLIERPKAGFSVPIGAWLRGPLRGWAEDLLSAELLHRQGFFRPDAVRALWIGHRDGAINQDAGLWNILAFQSWLQAAG